MRLPERFRRAPLLYSFVFLMVLALALSGLAYLTSVSHANSLLAQLKQQQRQEQASQQHQGAVLEQRLCTTLAEQAANEPPPGNAAGNPSRAWEQREHAILAQLGPDVGCGGRR